MRILGYAFLGLMVLNGIARAQNTNGTANASNTVVVNANTGTLGSGSDGTNGSGTNGSGATGTTSTVKQTGHLYGTPAVQGSYFAGANPCLIGVGASGAGGPIGLSFTFGRNDEGCTRRSDAAAWHALGHDEIAMARMCQDEDNADAFFAATGMACPGAPDKKRYKLADGTLAPVAQMHGNVAVTPVAATGYTPNIPNPAIAQQPSPNTVATTLPNDSNISNQVPDWCSTLTGIAERRHYAKTCGL